MLKDDKKVAMENKTTKRNVVYRPQEERWLGLEPELHNESSEDKTINKETDSIQKEE